MRSGSNAATTNAENVPSTTGRDGHARPRVPQRNQEGRRGKEEEQVPQRRHPHEVPADVHHRPDAQLEEDGQLFGQPGPDRRGQRREEDAASAHPR